MDSQSDSNSVFGLSDLQLSLAFQAKDNCNVALRYLQNFKNNTTGLQLGAKYTVNDHLTAQAKVEFDAKPANL